MKGIVFIIHSVFILYSCLSNDSLLDLFVFANKQENINKTADKTYNH